MTDRSKTGALCALTSSMRYISIAMLLLLIVGGLMGCEDIGQPVSPDPDPPRVANAIAHQEMVADDDPLQFDLDAVFADPSGEGLAYDAISADDAVATVSIGDALLSVEAVGGGTTTIVVEAKNEGGAAEANFEVEVILPDPPKRPDGV